jgi:hypothetical protein
MHRALTGHYNDGRVDPSRRARMYNIAMAAMEEERRSAAYRDYILKPPAAMSAQ